MYDSKCTIHDVIVGMLKKKLIFNGRNFVKNIEG